MEKAKPIGGKLFTKPFLVYLAIFLIAAYFIARRFIFGLGAVTNLSDGYPWGIWIAYDVIIGCALACGGYAMALVVYIMNKGRYHPLVRPAVLTSVFGYTLAGVSILFDIGRYWQFYNLMLPKYIQFNSVMVEVALCIMAYVLVLWIELSPAFLEKWNIKGLGKILEKVLFAVVALGIVLPTMHQSSLGALLLIAGSKVSPLWHTPLLPLLFLISCLVMGYCVVVAESVMSSSAFKREQETGMLSKIGVVVASLVAVYLVIRFVDLAARGGAITLSFAGDLKGNMFWIENALYIIPMLLLFMPKYNKDPRVLFASAAMLLLAAGLYRINAYLIGFDPGTGWAYFPSAPEMMITLGIVALEILLYLVFVKKLPILSEEPK